MCLAKSKDITHKHHLQVALLSVNAPPRRGPATEATAKQAPNKPWYIGRLCKGTVLIMMVIAPVKIPDDPNPAIARPMMSDVDVGAAPQRAEPTSKRKIPERKTHLVG